MASIPGREELRRRATQSLYPQVDIGQCFADPVAGRTDDARKFNYPADFEGYVLIFDDDIVYPKGYAKHMVAAVDRYDRKAVVSLMGRVVLGETHNYYTDRLHVPKYDWRRTEPGDVPVHIPGTGVLAYHTDTIRPRFPDDFPHENMADILMGILCAKKGIPVMRVAPPKKNWLEVLDTKGDDIWTRHVNDCELQTKLVNETQWPEI